MKHLALLLLALALAGCQLTLSSKTSGALQNAHEDPLLLAANAARARLIGALARLRNEASPPPNLCSVPLCGDNAAGCAALEAMSGEQSKSLYLAQTLLAPAKLAAWQSALQSAEVRVTDASGDVYEDGEVKDAVLRGKQIIVYSERTAVGRPDSLAAILAREGLYLTGETGTGRAGPFHENQDAVVAATACLLSYARGSEGATPAAYAPPAVFSDDFETESSAGLSALWQFPAQWFETLHFDEEGYAARQLASTVYSTDHPDAVVSGLMLKDLRIRARVSGAAILFLRVGSGKGYAVNLGNPVSVKRLSDGVTIAGGAASAPLSEVSVEMVGDRLRVFASGQQLLEVRDSSAADAGALGFSIGGDNRLASFSVENLGP